jgi:hypothetical protein
MPDISLDLRAVDYVTEQNLGLRAWRAFARVRFVAQNGLLVRFPAFVDPGAPFSVIPYSLWHGRRIRWAALGTHLMRAGKPVPEGLLWQGVRCELGTTEIHLLDLDAGIRTGPHRVVAKFARQRCTASHRELCHPGNEFSGRQRHPAGARRQRRGSGRLPRPPRTLNGYRTGPALQDPANLREPIEDLDGELAALPAGCSAGCRKTDLGLLAPVFFARGVTAGRTACPSWIASPSLYSLSVPDVQCRRQSSVSSG